MYEVRLFAVAEVHLYHYNWCTGTSSASVMTNGKFLRFGFCTDIMHTRKYIQHWKQDICVACEICWCVFDNKQTHNIYVLCTLHASSVTANCIKQEIVVRVGLPYVEVFCRVIDSHRFLLTRDHQCHCLTFFGPSVCDKSGDLYWYKNMPIFVGWKTSLGTWIHTST